VNVRRALAAAILGLMMGCVAAEPAFARTTFYVDDDAPNDTGSCLSPALAGADMACRTINAAIVKARAVPYPGGDDIRIAAGTYSGPVTLSDAGDDGNLIDGAGIPSLLNPSGTVVNYANNAPTAAFVIPAARTDIKVQDMLVQAQTAANDPRGFEVGGDRITLEDVEVEMEDDSSTEMAIFFTPQAEAGVLRRVTTSGIWDGVGLRSRAPDLSVFDSILAGSGHTSSAFAVFIDGGITTVRHSRLRAPPAGDAAVARVSPSGPGVTRLIAESTLITGGRVGVDVNSPLAGESGEAELRHVTVDVGTAGQVDNPLAGFRSVAVGPVAGIASADVDSSLLTERATSAGASTPLSCERTDVPSGSDCVGSANTTNPPSTLFLDAPGSDWRLRSTSPAIDTGAPILAPSESTADRAGAPRSVDGNFDCVVASDKGAYEIQGRSNTPPSGVAIAGPPGAEAGQPVALAASAQDAQDAPDALEFSWTFSDGGSASGASVFRAFAPGAHQATVTVTDSHGCSATGSRALAVASAADRRRPVISRVKAHPRRFTPVRRSRRGQGAAAAPRRGQGGTRFTFRLSERARVFIVIQAPRPGRRAGGRCVKAKRSNRAQPRCTRWLGATRLRKRASKGANSKVFSGHARGRPLSPGPYRARFGARDRAGNEARPRFARLRVVGG
jgi:PKD domain